MPWHGCPPAPARPTSGDGSPTNSLMIALMSSFRSPRRRPWRSGESEFRFSYLSAPGRSLREASHAMAERGIRLGRRQPPGAGLLGHEAHGGVLHRGARDAADQDDQPSWRFRPALLLPYGRRQRAGALLVSRRARSGARRVLPGHAAL